MSCSSMSDAAFRGSLAFEHALSNVVASGTSAACPRNNQPNPNSCLIVRKCAQLRTERSANVFIRSGFRRLLPRASTRSPSYRLAVVLDPANAALQRRPLTGVRCKQLVIPRRMSRLSRHHFATHLLSADAPIEALQVGLHDDAPASNVRPPAGTHW